MDYIVVSNLFKALADPTRVAAVRMLTVEKRCACQILEKLHISQPTLSHHMAILVSSGLVLSDRQGKWVFYGINPVNLNLMKTFLSELGTAPAPCAACGETR